jgi:hypothetical protein
MQNDYTVTSGDKIDYYSILKRRKRTVGDFIVEHNIRTLEELDAVVAHLKNEYVISDEFKALAAQALPQLTPAVLENSLEVPVSLPEPVAVPTEPESGNDHKPKKRIKKDN